MISQLVDYVHNINIDYSARDLIQPKLAGKGNHSVGQKESYGAGTINFCRTRALIWLPPLKCKLK